MSDARHNAHSFSKRGYTALVEAILENGFSVSDFHTCSPDEPHLILRHDVDQSVGMARRLSDLEASRGWKSTYFILVRSGMYNPFSRSCASDLTAIQKNGHEIGLHLDATFYASDDDLNSGAAIECRMLEDVLCQPIRIISFHRPSKRWIGNNVPLAGRPHTYMPRFIEEIGYCSDSRGQWGHGSPLEHKSLKERRALQLLTHPVWWTAGHATTPVEKLRHVLESAAAELDRELADNNSVWRRP